MMRYLRPDTDFPFYTEIPFKGQRTVGIRSSNLSHNNSSQLTRTDSDCQNESNMDKQKISEEERLALAAKLDNDLEEFISGLEKRRPSEKVPIDQWEKVSKFLKFLSTLNWTMWIDKLNFKF